MLSGQFVEGGATWGRALPSFYALSGLFDLRTIGQGGWFRAGRRTELHQDKIPPGRGDSGEEELGRSSRVEIGPPRPSDILSLHGFDHLQKIGGSLDLTERRGGRGEFITGIG